MTYPGRVGRYADAELLVLQWMTGFDPNVRVVTRLPATLPAEGVVWVAGAGGFSDWDEANLRVDLQILIPGEEGTVDSIAEAAHNHMAGLTGKVVNGQAVNLVRCTNTFIRRFWAEGVDRMVGTYQLDLPVL